MTDKSPSVSPETESQRTIFLSSELRLPAPPNYITIDGKFVPQQGSGGELPKIDVKDLDDAVLVAIGEAWAKRLIEHAHARRNAKPQPTPR